MIFKRKDGDSATIEDEAAVPSMADGNGHAEVDDEQVYVNRQAPWPTVTHPAVERAPRHAKTSAERAAEKNGATEAIEADLEKVEPTLSAVIDEIDEIDELPEADEVIEAEAGPSALGGSDAQLAEILIKRGVVSPEMIDRAVAAQGESGGRLGDVLFTLGVVDDRELVLAHAEMWDIPVADLGREDPQAEALALIDEATAREFTVIPLKLDAEGLHVAVADEPLPAMVEVLAKKSGKKIKVMLAPMAEVRRAIDNSYLAVGGVDELIQAFEAVESSRRRSTEQAVVTDVTENAPVVQVVTRILTQAMRDRASDVHIEPSDKIVRVRFRVDGVLKEILTLPASMGPGLVGRLKIMADMNIVERRRPQDGQLTTEIDGKEVDVRVSTLATIWGEKCVLRILDKTRSVLRLKDLGFPSDTADKYSHLVRAPFGMVLCVGPTGSGKTTTLYATLSEIADKARNVMTVEDPVEYVFPSVNQIQTNEQAGLTFATGLRSILRQDPDVILVGEIRDVETARIAVQSALTGHFVLSSLHATDAVSGLHRFLDMGIESFLISSSVVGIVGQRLVRRTCTACKVRYTPTSEEMAFYEESGGPEKTDFYRGEGCNFCGGTGYLDRIGVYELLRMTPELRRLIVGWATQDELSRQAQKQGMRTLRQEAINLVSEDVTTVSEVIRSIYAM